MVFCFKSMIFNAVNAGELKSRLEAVEQDLSKNRVNREQLNRTVQKTSTELEKIQKKGINLAKAHNVLSARADKLEASLERLHKNENKKLTAMAQRKKQLMATSSALQRIARVPVVALISIPQSHNNTIRSAILLRAVIPKLQGEATGLAEEIKLLAALQADIAEDKKSLAETLVDLDRRRRALSSLSAKKITLLEKTQTAEQHAVNRAARLSARAGNIRDLLRELSRHAGKPETFGRKLAKPQSDTTSDESGKKIAATLRVTPWGRTSPAPGHIITSFGDRMPNGTLSKGVFIKTRSSAPVVSPTKGRVVFAGNFRGYGNLVIIELPNKDHVLLAGMVRVSTGIGDEVLAGEPLGEMAPSFGVLPKLYFELRKQGRPINPLPFKAAHRSKVRG